MSRIATKTQIKTLRTVRTRLKEGLSYQEARQGLPRRTLRSLFTRKFLYHCPETGVVTVTSVGNGLLAQVDHWEYSKRESARIKALRG